MMRTHQYKDCPNCKGSGRIANNKKCPVCKGSGVVKQRKVIQK